MKRLTSRPELLPLQMFIDIEKNPNCSKTGLFAFEELGVARPIKGVHAEENGKEVVYEVTGVDHDGVFIPAYAQKVSDSGSGIGFLIYGGTWGVRLKPKALSEAWDLKNKNQHGEAYMIYGEAGDIDYV